MDDSSRQRVNNTIRFMKLTAIQLRRIAEHEPELNEELRRFADQLEQDADELGATTVRSLRS